MMAKKKAAKRFPDAATLRKVRETLSDVTYKGGNLALPGNATEVERAKFQLCQLIARFRREHELTQRDLAGMLEIDEARISECLRCKIQGFTLDRLLGYAQKLYPNVKVDIRAA
jgi:predicted XRE-type DNA-binding protein